MTIYQFNQLDKMEQIEAFWDAVLVGKISKDGFIYECRQIDDFYVEYKINPTTKHYLFMRTFKNPDLLDPYLGWMNLNI